MTKQVGLRWSTDLDLIAGEYTPQGGADAVRLTGSGSYGPYGRSPQDYTPYGASRPTRPRQGGGADRGGLADCHFFALAGKLPTWPLVHLVIAGTGCE